MLNIFSKVGNTTFEAKITQKGEIKFRQKTAKMS